MKLYDKGVFLVGGNQIIEDGREAEAALLQARGKKVEKDAAKRGTIA